MNANLQKIDYYIKFLLISFIYIIVSTNNLLANNSSDSTQIISNEQKLKNDKNERYMALIDSSFNMGDKGRFEEAILLLDEALNIYPNNDKTQMIMNNIAGLYQLLGKYDKAIETYTLALDKETNNQTIRFNRALLYAKIKNDKAALTDYSILVSQYPNNQLYKYQRAMIYILQKEYDLAYNDLNDILSLDQNSLKAREGLAMLETIRENYDEAERIYNYLIEKLPNNAQIYEGRARLFLQRKYLGYAIRDINKAVELSKSKPTSSIYLLRSKIFEAMGEKEEAERDLNTANALSK